MAAQARRIVVGYDDSESSQRALDRAADLAGYGSTLTVVSVAPEGEDYAPGPLENARERLLRRHVTATYLQPVGEPADELVGAAQELDADLVVVGRRNRSLRRLVLGSVSAGVARQAPCDVLIVR
jgi:nucleotide-binding universal stress UspA family protein